MAVSVSGGEVHGSEPAAPSEHLVYQTDALEERRPVQRRHKPQTGDDVAHGHVRGGLALVLGAYELVRRSAPNGQLLVQPTPRGCRRGVLLPQALRSEEHTSELQ